MKGNDMNSEYDGGERDGSGVLFWAAIAVILLIVGTMILVRFSGLLMTWMLAAATQ